MTWLGQIHFAFAVIAIVSGLGVVTLRKGTLLHRRTGWIYAVSMLSLNGTAFGLYRLFGGFGPFHVAALVSLGTVVAGLIPVIRRKPRGKWIEHHAYWMTWSYVGLLAAAASELTTRVPESPFWWMVVGSTLLVVAVGKRLITWGVPRALRSMKKTPRPLTGAPTTSTASSSR